jgi:DNA polymerase-3 subunit gamma/tau
VRIPPQIGKYSIYIIDEVHMLSSSAFNAFLKTLEEPPSHAIFILATTEKHKIIPTILSRCQIFDFNRIRLEDIVKRLVYVAGNESVMVEEEALHIIAQKADGALRDALSIFDQLVSLCGKKIRYRDVIENLNVLDYEYYFRCIDGALRGDISNALMIFNEILEKGFDGHNFVAGLNSHLRDLLVSKDEVTLRLLEATPSVRQKYLEQSARCPVDFLYRALDAGSNCDISYKSSKNPRLHAELWLIRLCRIMAGISNGEEKKKPEGDLLKKEETEISLPSRSEIIRKDEETKKREYHRTEKAPATHIPVLEKPSKSFSIREVFADNKSLAPRADTQVQEPDIAKISEGVSRSELTPESFAEAWKRFIEEQQGDGPRIISMFKSIQPELEDEHTIRIHLSNAAQKDLFVQNYKPKLKNFIENRFIVQEFDIDTAVDLTETDELLYTDEQKYSYLQNKYPALKDFKKAFNLDIT